MLVYVCSATFVVGPSWNCPGAFGKVMFGLCESTALWWLLWSAQESLCGCCCQSIQRRGAVATLCASSSPANNDWMDESKIFENELSLTFRIVLVPQAGLKVFVLVPEALSYFVLQEKSEDHVLGGSTTVMRDFFQAIQVVSLSEPDAAFWN